MTDYAILIYDGVEPIDLGATFGVLSMARRVKPSIQAFGVARRSGAVKCANGLTVLADCAYSDCPAFDALIVTGGPGWPDAAADTSTLAFIKTVSKKAAIASICTGAMILAASGCLDGRAATTKVEIIGEERVPLDLLEENYPAIAPRKATAVLSDGILTSGGVSLGIDGVLHLIGKLDGRDVMMETARVLEYRRALKANAEALPLIGFE